MFISGKPSNYVNAVAVLFGAGQVAALHMEAAMEVEEGPGTLSLHMEAAMEVEEGPGTLYLLGLKPEYAKEYYYPPMPAGLTSPNPSHAGKGMTLAMMAEAEAAAEAAAEAGASTEHKEISMYWNQVRHCSCGKPNGKTASKCTGCQEDISDVKETTSSNVMMAFVMGAEWIVKGVVPATVSLHYENERLCVMNDVGRLSKVHTLTLPTSEWIPSATYLFTNPTQALVLLNEMKQETDTVNRKMLSDKNFREQNYNKDGLKELFPGINVNDKNAVVEALMEVARYGQGFNIPPSHYQLHMLTHVAPLFPVDHAGLMAGVHFAKGRWFHYDFLEQCLMAARDQGQSLFVDENTSSEYVIQFCGERGIDYDQIYDDLIGKFKVASELLSGKYPDLREEKLFTHKVLKDQTVIDLENGEVLTDQTVINQMKKHDKIAMQYWNEKTGVPKGYLKYKQTPETIGTQFVPSKPGTPKSEPGTPKSEPGTPKSEPGTPKSEPGTPQSPGTPKSARSVSMDQEDQGSPRGGKRQRIQVKPH